MVTQLENLTIREIIDNSYAAGYNEAIKKVFDWLEHNADNYTWYDEEEGESGVTDEFFEDLETAVKLENNK